MPTTSSHQMHEMLAKHYAPPPSKPAGGMLIKEIQAPQSTRQADALWLPTTSAERGRIIGHEIKVSRADLITELHDPHKADAWKQFCSRWWLVISDPKFIEGLDIPDDWGILAPPSRSTTRFMTIVKKAPQLTPTGDMARAWGTVFAKTAYSGLAAQEALTRYKHNEQNLIEQRTELMREVAQLKEQEGLENPYRHTRIKISEVISHIETIGGYSRDSAFSGLAWRVDSEKLARLLLSEVALEERVADADSNIEHALERVERAAKELRAIRTAIQMGEDD